MIALDDHALQLQWDGSKTDKGFKDLERKFAKFGKMDIKASVSPDMKRGGSRGVGKSSISQGERDRGVANLDATALKARQQIEALRKVGSKEAKASILALESAVKRLKAAEDGLNKSTKTTDKSFIAYKKTLRDTKNQINSMSKSTNVLARKFTTAKFASNGLASSLKNLGRSWISVFAAMAGVRIVKEVSKSFETVSATLLLASGSAEQAASDFKFLEELSNRVGVSFLDSAKAFAKYAVAARGAGLTDGQMRESFEDLSVAIRATGLTQDDANLSFLALQQMLSNGVVSMEELRKQLSERMPQTMEVAKKALRNLGYEFTSLKEIISTGTVDSGPFVKELTRLMAEQARVTGAFDKQQDSITAEEDRMTNAFNSAINAASQAGLETLFRDVFGGLKHLLIAVTPAIVALGAAFGTLAHVIALPFKMLDQFAQLLGFEEGTGIQFAIRALVLVMLYKLIPALIGLNVKLGEGAVKALAMGRSFLVINKGANAATLGVNRLKFAVKGLMRAAWPLLLLEGVFRGLEFLNTKSQIQEVGKKSSISDSSPSKSTNINVENMNIQQKSGESPEEFGVRIFSGMDSMAQSQVPIS